MAAAGRCHGSGGVTEGVGAAVLDLGDGQRGGERVDVQRDLPLFQRGTGTEVGEDGGAGQGEEVTVGGDSLRRRVCRSARRRPGGYPAECGPGDERGNQHSSTAYGPEDSMCFHVVNTMTGATFRR